MFSLQDYSFENLKNKNCYPFEPGTKALTKEQANEALDFIFINFSDKETRKERWKLNLINNSLALNGRFYFNSYQKTFAFISAIYLISLEQNYYPDIMFGDGFAFVTLFTIKLKGLHENDFIMLAKIEAMMQGKGERKILQKNDEGTEQKKVLKKSIKKADQDI